jgi:hypothetical protein
MNSTRHMMKSSLITAVAAVLALFLGVSAQGELTTTAAPLQGELLNVTTLDVDLPGATDTRAYGIDGSKVVGYYEGVHGYHGFIAAIPEPATLSLLTLGTLIFLRRRH